MTFWIAVQVDLLRQASQELSELLDRHVPEHPPLLRRKRNHQTAVHSRYLPGHEMTRELLIDFLRPMNCSHHSLDGALHVVRRQRHTEDEQCCFGVAQRVYLTRQ